MIVSRSAVHYALSNDETWWIDVAMYSHVPIVATWIDKDNRHPLIRDWQYNCIAQERPDISTQGGMHHTKSVA